MSLRDEIIQVHPQSDLRLGHPPTLDAILSDHPWLPADYREFLERVGWGRVGRVQFMFYEGPVPYAEIFGVPHPACEILLIGDNFAGYHIGYSRDASGGQLVAFDHCSPEDLEQVESLEAFVRAELIVGAV